MTSVISLPMHSFRIRVSSCGSFHHGDEATCFVVVLYLSRRIRFVSLEVFLWEFRRLSQSGIVILLMLSYYRFICLRYCGITVLSLCLIIPSVDVFSYQPWAVSWLSQTMTTFLSLFAFTDVVFILNRFYSYHHRVLILLQLSVVYHGLLLRPHSWSLLLQLQHHCLLFRVRSIIFIVMSSRVSQFKFASALCTAIQQDLS